MVKGHAGGYRQRDILAPVFHPVSVDIDVKPLGFDVVTLLALRVVIVPDDFVPRAPAVFRFIRINLPGNRYFVGQCQLMVSTTDRSLSPYWPVWSLIVSRRYLSSPYYDQTR